MKSYDLDDYTEDCLVTQEPSFSIEPDEWLEIDLVSMAID